MCYILIKISLFLNTTCVWWEQPFSWKFIINTSVSSAFVPTELKPLIIPLMTNERFYCGASVALYVRDQISFPLKTFGWSSLNTRLENATESQNPT